MIKKIEGKKFDHQKLMKDYANACLVLGSFPDQMNVTCPEAVTEDRMQLLGVAGTNWDYDKGEVQIPESDFIRTSNPFQGTYVEHVVNLLREDYNIGRVRFLTLQPKTCYSWHTDLEEYRLHIPLKTDLGAFFIWHETQPIERIRCERMRVEGQLYTFKTNTWHTAINSDKKTRTHLVLNVIEEENGKTAGLSPDP